MPNIAATEQQINFSNEYVLGSGAHLTHLNHPFSTAAKMQKLRTTTADGNCAPMTHSGPVNMQHTGPQPLRMPKALAAPTFKRPLLSVNQMRSQHDALFQQRKAHLLPQNDPPHPSVLQGTATA